MYVSCDYVRMRVLLLFLLMYAYNTENVCCRSRTCLTTTDMFETIVLNRDVLSVAIIH